jgi:hypothetical protein
MVDQVKVLIKKKNLILTNQQETYKRGSSPPSVKGSFFGAMSLGKEGPLYNSSKGPKKLGPTLNIFGLLFGPKLLINARTLARKSRY